MSIFSANFTEQKFHHSQLMQNWENPLAPNPVYEYRESVDFSSKIRNIFFTIRPALLFIGFIACLIKTNLILPALCLTPLIFYDEIRHIIGSLILQSTLSSTKEYDESRRNVHLLNFEEKKQVKRISIAIKDSSANSFCIDGLQIHNKHAPKDSWMIINLGNGASYEKTVFVYFNYYKGLISYLNCNVVIMNYPNVGRSSKVSLSPKVIESAAKATLTYVDKHLGAQKILTFGHSFGGGAQALMFKNYPLNSNKFYLKIKSRTFCSLAKIVGECVEKIFQGPCHRGSRLAGKAASALTWFFGWDISVTSLGRNNSTDELILQTGTGENIIDDDLIPPSASLAQYSPREKVLLIPERHNHFLERNTLEQISYWIKEKEAKKAASS